MATTPSTQASDERTERLRRRLIAARSLADITVRQLAERIQQAGHVRGYSADNLGLMERGRRPIQPQNIPVLAEACGLPTAFFTIDFARLDEAPPDLTRRIEEMEAQQADDAIRLAQLEEAVQALGAKDHRERGTGGARR